MTKDEFKEMVINEIEVLANEYGFTTNVRSMFLTDSQVSLNIALYGDVKGVMELYSGEHTEEETEEESSVIQIDNSIENDNEVLEEVDLTMKSQAV